MTMIDDDLPFCCCKTCAIDIGLSKTTYLLTYIHTYLCYKPIVYKNSVVFAVGNNCNCYSSALTHWEILLVAYTDGLLICYDYLVVLRKAKLSFHILQICLTANRNQTFVCNCALRVFRVCCDDHF